MKQPALIAIIIVLLIWATAGTAVSLRYRRAAEAASNRAADLKLDVDELQKRLKKSESRALPTTPVILPSPAPAEAAAAEHATVDPRLASMEAALREKDAQLAALRQTTVSNRPSWGFGGPRDGQNWLDELKKNKPDEYAEFMKRREESRQQVQRAFAEKADHFLKRDTSKMTDEEKAAHQAMVALLDSTWNLSEKLKTDLSGDERREVMSTMRENLHQLQPMLDNERDNEFYQAGKSLGLADAQAVQFVQQMNDVIDVTSMRPVMEAMRGGGHGGGGGGPGGGRSGR